MVGTWNLGVAFQDRVASVVGRDQRVGNAVVLSSGYVCGPQKAENAVLNNRRIRGS